jgi:hypothetical protein
MKITDVVWALREGHPLMELKTDGEPAELWLKQKRTLVEGGYVLVDPRDVWERRLPRIEVNDPARGWFVTLTSFSRSPELRRLLEQAWAASDASQFRPGSPLQRSKLD